MQNQKKISEGTLRKLVRSFWAGDDFSLTWHEANFGGTVGQPDVTFKLGTLSWGLELKEWVRNRDGKLICHIRPSQRRFHLVEAMAGRRTGFLILEGDARNSKLHFIPGHATPTVNIPRNPEIYYVCDFVAGNIDLDTARSTLEDILLDNATWDVIGGTYGRD